MTRELSAAPSKLSRTDLQAYWQRLSGEHLRASADGFEVICYAGMPRWFNAFIHRYQVKAFRRLLQDEFFADCDILDIGTGVGRWARCLAQWRGTRIVGIDVEPARLARAAAMGGGPAYKLMSADALAFADASFDVVNSVTVLQHVGDGTKSAAIAEIARVLRPGGRVILFEITDVSDDARHVFPWRQEAWEAAFASHGLYARRKVGEQYIPLLRMLKRAHIAASSQDGRAEIDALKAGRATLRDRATMTALRMAVAASYPIEEFSRFLPNEHARITGFLFQKDTRA